ncbi:membrane fusion protein (multidrug efflux system) [Litorivivens lipolytica]|uniref:Membrane fusion protein (Multidrug efflux system) n=1 Tax=Litorivivens lipolytica TaxID=1524264 RepID=A0A7W4Z677_9GAMM|nr:efflux RND transporter periplasmic adaptor subunit [Litorivivens lipolytica]MBB3046655.1 membrane fusion protein (multidrug efflux system) [Litorivivens lipolytica]
MRKFMYTAITLLTLSVVFGAIFGFIEFRDRMVGSFVAAYIPPPVGVEADPALEEQWDTTLSAVGTVKAVNGVDITTEASGLIKEIYFASGQEVDEGDVLIQLDDEVEQANLKSFKAQYRLAKINFDRDSRLMRSNAISRTEFDKVEAQLADMKAQVERTEATISQKKIKAPFSGRLGLRQVNVGEFINSGDDIVTLQALDELLIEFSVPEYFTPKLYVGQKIRFTVTAFGQRVFEATISSINAKVDETTRNIQVQGNFLNDTGKILPGMFANVSIILEEQKSVITVPQTAISYSLYGDSVFVVSEQELNLKTPDTTLEIFGLEIDLSKIHKMEIPPERGLAVSRRYVKLGERQGNRVSIVEGVSAGELVVTAGQLKLNNGTRVEVIEQKP